MCAKDQVGKNRNKRKKDKANVAQTPETLCEFAGNASAPSSPIPPNFDWVADTGAISHMTPHCHWVRNYSPLRIPIRLADNRIVYLSGVGTVVFNPVMMDGKPSQPVEFTRVLHVPSASSHKPDIVCEPCLAAKMHSNPFPSSPSRSTKPLELVHSDLPGPLPVATREGYRYWITFLDDATSYRAAMHLRPSSCSRLLMKTNSMRKSRNCRMTKGGNTCPTSSSNSLIPVEFIDATQLATGRSRTE